MILTIILIMFLITLPTMFKKAGVTMISEEKKRGHFLYFMSKFIPYAILVELSYIWAGAYFLFCLGLCISLFFIHIHAKRAYIFPYLYQFKRHIERRQLTKERKKAPIA